MAGKKNKVELQELLEKAVTKVTSDFDVDEIILFGSYAKGTANDLSDVDVAIVSPDLERNKPVFANSIKIARKTKLYEPYLQLMPFPSKTFYQEDFVDPRFIQEIKRTGTKIYTKDLGSDFTGLI